MHSMMSELLIRLGWTSLQSALLVGLVWGVCRLLPQLPAATRCRLWWLVALQAVLGLVWSSPLELAVLPAPQVLHLAAVPMTALPAVVDMPALAAPAVQDMAFAGPGLPTWRALLLAAWAAGVMLMLLRSVQAYRASRALVRTASDCTDAGLQRALQMAAEAHGLRRAPALKISTQIRSPQLIGPWHPVLLLPARELPAMAADDLDMALTHELVHLQRRDLWWGLLPALAQHLLFFHPLLHLAAREYLLTREEACDSAVVAGHGHCRQHYGRLLLQLGVAPRPAAGVASASPDFHSLKRRLLTLQRTRTFPRGLSLAITAAFVLVGVAPLRLVAAIPPAPPLPPAAPAAPAPEAPETPRAAPAAPRAATAPTAPAAPLPPAAPLLVTHGRLDLSRQPAQAYVLIDDDDNFVDASVADIRQAHRDARDEDKVLWVRRGDARYLIRDPAVLARLHQAYAEVGALGEQQGALGDRQAELGERSAELAERAAEEAMSALDEAAIADHASRTARVQAAQAIDAKALAASARHQAELASQQALLAQRQSVATARAAREVSAAVDQALASGEAQRLLD